MISESLTKTYGKEVPIFSDEILRQYPNYSKVYVFRQIKIEVISGNLLQFDRGVYYIPDIRNPFTTITPDQVMEKKYLGSKKNPIGIYSGYYLKNQFEVTRQMSNVKEIVSNNEYSKRREVEIGGINYILKKARTTITRDNENQYRLLELFAITGQEDFNPSAIENVKEYMKREKISKKSLLIMSKYFPRKAITNMINLGVI